MPRARKISTPVRLEQRMVLLFFLNAQLGFKSNRELLESVKDAGEGFDAEGRSYVALHIASRGDKVKISPTQLVMYDENINMHVRAINAHRRPPITLRYFQYLAVLYVEMFLHRYFRSVRNFQHELNEWVEARNAEVPDGVPRDEKFSEDDLKKLALWMATGSGKTLIMHINYRQFLHYNKNALDNILLITPNEGMSEQHLAELTASDIPAARFDLKRSGFAFHDVNCVRVIEITKLVGTKRSRKGVRVPVEAFEGNNLVFVDEGHKGSGGAAWRAFREALGNTGFTFEYSATFGQALHAAKSNALTMEYGKAIVFDYSYRYFYGDGFGKDFRILNLQEETSADKTDMLLLGNLLSFYEQQLLFANKAEVLRDYHLQKPLWVFVGSSVQGVYTRDKKKRSDVLTVARFLHRVLQDKAWTVDTIEQLIKGHSGLLGADGSDVFASKFAYLKTTRHSKVRLYNNILSTIFHAPSGGGLHLCSVRGATGELGMKAAGAERYFGLIYIGDVSAFKKLVGQDEPGITLEDDVIRGSLFERINRADSDINILAGAKKFTEGWNSWRVSNMGLLNIGRSEGAQIIQLFGRGVRLQGQGHSLKRSAALSAPSGQQHPAHIALLETLNIFSVRANYMARFREYLEREGVEHEERIELPLFIRINKEFLNKGLVVPRMSDGHQFTEEANLLLARDTQMPKVRVDLSLKVQALQGGAEGHAIAVADAQLGRDVTIPQENFNLVDWERVYLDLIEYKERKGWANMVVRPQAVRDIVESSGDDALYQLVADDTLVAPATFQDAELLQETVTGIVRSYADKFYGQRLRQWESKNLEYKLLDKSDSNFTFGQASEVPQPGARANKVKEPRAGYVVSVPCAKAELVEEIKKLIKDCEHLYQQESNECPRIYFDRHLYQPLFVTPKSEGQEVIKVSPPPLNKSEVKFVRDLKNYWQNNQGAHASTEVFLLRNQSRGAGVGFFAYSGFYPDFILWIVSPNAQRIVFIEPHGMLHANAYQHDDKARLYEELPKLAKQIGARSNARARSSAKPATHKPAACEVQLDSYIISVTPFDVLCKKYDDGSWDRDKFAAHHILFLEERREEYDYVQKILEGGL